MASKDREQARSSPVEGEDGDEPQDAGGKAERSTNGRATWSGPSKAELRQQREELARSRDQSESLRAEIVALQAKLEQADGRTKRLARRAARLEARAKDGHRERDELRRAVRLAATRRGMPAQDTPVFFLIGRAKSGTSWLMRLLNAHPEILCRGEGRFFSLDYKRADVRKMDSKTLQPSSLHRALMDAGYLRSWIQRSVWTRDRDEDEQLAEVMRTLTNHFLAASAAAAGKRIVGDKTPFLGSCPVGEIAEVYPEAKVIHIIRDGRDVAVSAMHHLWEHEIDLGGGVDLSKEEAAIRDGYRADPAAYLDSGRSIFTPKRLTSTAREWARLVEQTCREGPQLLGESYSEVRYEELLARPEEELARLLTFLGAGVDERTLGACVEAASFERWSKGRKRGQEDSTHLMRKGIAGDWRDVFTDADRRAFKAQGAAMLIELGYERDSSW